jgi:hypothetical protein
LRGGIKGRIDSIQDVHEQYAPKKKRMSTTDKVASLARNVYSWMPMGKRPTSRSAGSDAKRHHAVAILGATVLSLSNFSLFRLKACCRQSSRLLHAWCSGNRCCKRPVSPTGSSPKLGTTYRSTKVRATMGAVANNAQRSLVALLLAVELATLLGRHD